MYLIRIDELHYELYRINFFMSMKMQLAKTWGILQDKQTGFFNT